MSEPLRGSPASDGPSIELDEAGREARIEQLLLSGLDQYFAGRFEQAIDVWTRVAFLERGHGRARAYIARARSALAERHRESEELFHRGVEAYQEGRLDAARALLTQAVERGDPSDTALAFLQRVRRLEPAPAAPAATEARRRAAPAAGTVSSGTVLSGTVSGPVRASVRWAWTALASAAIVAGVVAIASPLTAIVAEWPAAAPAARAVPLDPLPVPELSEGLLRRARALHAAGRSKEALTLLETVVPGDPLRSDVDALRADIQRVLLGRVGGTGASASRPAPEASR